MDGMGFFAAVLIFLPCRSQIKATSEEFGQYEQLKMGPWLVGVYKGFYYPVIYRDYNYNQPL